MNHPEIAQIVENPVLNKVYHLNIRGFSKFAAKVSKDADSMNLHILNVRVNEPNKGTFTRFIESLRSDFQNINIHMENVVCDYLPAKLIRMGFIQKKESFPPSFILV